MMEDYCPLCNNQKYIQELNSFKPCECLKKSKYVSKLRHSGINEEFDEVTYESLEKEWKKNSEKVLKLQRFKEYAKRIIDKKTKHYNQPFLIVGRDGSGKMLMAACFLKECIKNGKTVFLTNLNTIIDETFNEDPELKRQFFDKVYHSDVLCLQLGTERKNVMNNDMLSTIYNTRKNKKKYTIFVSRPPESKFGAIYGDVGRSLDERERIDL